VVSLLKAIKEITATGIVPDFNWIPYNNDPDGTLLPTIITNILKFISAYSLTSVFLKFI